MTTTDGFPTAANPTPIACTLTTQQLPVQMADWTELRSAVTDTTTIDGGVRLTMPAALEPAARDLAAREHDCCAFLVLTVRIDGGACVMDITSPHPHARPVIEIIAWGSVDEHR